MTLTQPQESKLSTVDPNIVLQLGKVKTTPGVLPPSDPNIPTVDSNMAEKTPSDPSTF